MVDSAQEPPAAGGPGPEFPQAVRIAGIIWVVFGCVILLNALVNLLVGLAAGNPGSDSVIGGVCGGLFGLFVGGVFLHVGRQSMRGKAADTLGNGVGSIIVGLINTCVFGLTSPALAGVPVLLYVIGTISLLSTGGLIAAGVLALVGRSQYREWRRAEKARRAADAGGRA